MNTVLDYFVVIAGILMAVFTVLGTAGLIKMRRKLRGEPDKIKLARNMRHIKIAIVCNILSAVMCAVILVFDAYDIREIKSGERDCDYSAYSQTETLEEFRGRLLNKTVRHFRMWALLGVCWLLSAGFSTDELINGKFAYITDKNVYLGSKCMSADNFSYEMDGEELRLYYRRYKKPIVYTVIEDRERLASTLAENYKPYQEL